MIPEQVRLILRLSRPFYLLVGILMYTLGVGIANYLGFHFQWIGYFTGLVWVLSIQLTMHFFLDYFDPRMGGENASRNPFTGVSGALGVGSLPRAVALWAGLAALSVAASLTFLMLQLAKINPAALLMMVLLAASAIMITVPPIRLVSSGYGELTLSIWMANLVPAFAFLLRTGEYHRLIAMTTFPLTALHLVMILAHEFADFAHDVKFEIPTLLSRMGWRSGMTVHNLLILSAFMLLGIAALFGLPQVISLPAFLPLPLGLLEIWQMTRISAGAQPNWRSLKLNAITIFIGTAYLLTFAYWTR